MTRKRKAYAHPSPPAPPVAAAVRRDFTTFMPVDNYSASQMTQDAPSSFNGMVRVRRYRVTVELVDEPIETIRARIVDLWERNDNHHQWDAIRTEAARYGLDLTPYARGSKKAVRP
mgnify:FL=1